MPISTSTFPRWSRTIIWDLWQGGGALSNHPVTCPDDSGVQQRRDADVIRVKALAAVQAALAGRQQARQQQLSAPQVVILAGGETATEARLRAARAVSTWSPCKDNPANCWF